MSDQSEPPPLVRRRLSKRHFSERCGREVMGRSEGGCLALNGDDQQWMPLPAAVSVSGSRVRPCGEPLTLYH